MITIGFCYLYKRQKGNLMARLTFVTALLGMEQVNAYHAKANYDRTTRSRSGSALGAGQP